MTTKTQTIETHLGSIEAETTECTHCENEVLTEDSIQVGIGARTVTYGRTNDRERTSYRKTKQLCPYCAEALFGYTNGSEYTVPSIELDGEGIIPLIIVLAISLLLFFFIGDILIQMVESMTQTAFLLEVLV